MALPAKVRYTQHQSIVCKPTRLTLSTPPLHTSPHPSPTPQMQPQKPRWSITPIGTRRQLHLSACFRFLRVADGSSHHASLLVQLSQQLEGLGRRLLSPDISIPVGKKRNRLQETAVMYKKQTKPQGTATPFVHKLQKDERNVQPSGDVPVVGLMTRVKHASHRRNLAQQKIAVQKKRTP